MTAISKSVPDCIDNLITPVSIKFQIWITALCLKGSKQICEKKQDELEDQLSDTCSENVDTGNKDDTCKEKPSKRKRKKVNRNCVHEMKD